MSYDQEHRVRSRAGIAGGLDISPGKSSLADKLYRRAIPGRDDNGVAEDAGSAIDRAASSDGTTLPDEVRDRFEGSLGADLSGVRVHTGGESATAAESVGAKAYTVGNDIHFGAGHYDPGSSEGLQLIAHEVAHTVQQTGAAPTRQHKLEVTTSRDAAEVEADRAADAMVTGAAATVTSSAPAIARDEDEDWKAMKKAGAREGYRVDPTDPYEKAPTDWSGMSGGFPMGDAFVPTYDFAAPKGWIGPDGCPSAASEEQILRAETAKTAFSGAMGTVADSTTVAYALEKAFNEAGNAIDGELGKSLGWGEVGGGKKDLASVAGGQEANGVTIDDLFPGKASNQPGTNADVDLSGSKQTQGTKDAKLQVNLAVTDLQTAQKAYQGAVGMHAGLGRDVANAVAQLEIKAAAGDVANKETELKSAQDDKQRIVDGIQTTCKILEGGIKAANAISNPKDNWADAAELVLMIGEAVATASMTHDVDKKIETLTGQIGSAKSQITARNIQLANDQVDTARAKFAAHKSTVDAAKTAVTTAAGKVQVAYNTFAVAAGAAAGGTPENQKKVEAAIRAIPKVQLVVAEASKVTNACNLPSYSAEAGRGFNASCDAIQFGQHYGRLKGMKTEFKDITVLWGNRLRSLQAVAGAFGGPGNGPQCDTP